MSLYMELYSKVEWKIKNIPNTPPLCFEKESNNSYSKLLIIIRLGRNVGPL